MKPHGRALFLLLLVAPIAAFADDAYTVDLQHSRVYARIDAVRIGHNHGIEGRLQSGDVNFSGSGQFVFDMLSFSADTAQARSYVGLRGTVSSSDRRKTTENMQSSDVLDVSQFPTATFVIQSMKSIKVAPNQKPEYIVQGQFTLHGVTQPVAFRTVVEPINGNASGVLRMTGSFLIRQSDFGMTPYSAFGGLAKVSNDVTIWGDLLLVPSSQEGAQKPSKSAASPQ
jgi:polyisoprenoid-binding protein YceI